MESGSNTFVSDRMFHVNPTPLTYKRRGRGGLDSNNHNTPTHVGHRVFIRKRARTYLNPHAHRIQLLLASVSTPTLKTSHKSTIVGAHHGAHEIKLRESNDISIYNQVSSRLQVVFGLS
jgi:hypothetical protein